MDIKAAAVIFATVFVAELGDKTQLATMLFAADQDTSRWLVFFSAAAALVLSVAVAVLAGSLITQYLSENTLRYVAGAGFIAIGAWTLLAT